jgi:hypothetical protein
MKQRNTWFALATAVCLFEATPSLAASSVEDTQARLESAIQKVNLQTVALQEEVKQLRAELRKVKQEKHVLAPRQTAAATQEVKKTPAHGSPSILNLPQIHVSPVVVGELPAGASDLDPSAFLSFQPGMFQSAFFLEQQQAFENTLKGTPPPYAERPQLLLSGKLETAGTLMSPYAGSSISSIDLVTAEIEALAQVSEWASGFLTITYNNGLSDPLLTGSGNPTNNSGFYLNRGFLTIGNLNKTPFYFAAGQMYAPFGTYASNMISNLVTSVMGRTNTRLAQIGFDKGGFNAAVYAFNGAPNLGTTKINNWGANASYKFSLGNYGLNLGAGFINDISGSRGAQTTGKGLGSFAGFSQNSATETLVHYVPGVDFSAMLSRGPWYAVVEGLGATRSYDPTNMTFDNQGAQPKAAHAETGFNFKMFGKKSIFNVAYEETWDALAMGLPKNSYIATLNSSIWKNTVETLEFRHDVNYASTDIASGTCIATAANGSRVISVCPGGSGGGTSNILLLQFGVYF